MTANTTSTNARRQSSRADEASSLKPELSLDRWAQDILELTPMLLLRRVPGETWNIEAYKDVLKQRFAAAVDAVPAWVGDEAKDLESGDDVAGDALSEWGINTRFTSQFGTPLPLQEEGELSLTSLIRSISKTANVREVITRLIETNSIELRDGLYHHKMRNMELRKLPKLQPWHHVRVIWHALKTVEGNARRKEELRRFEFMAVGLIPREMHTDFRNEIEGPSLGCLETVDNIVTRSTALAPASETIRVTVGIIQVDDLPLPPLQKPAPIERKDAES